MSRKQAYYKLKQRITELENKARQLHNSEKELIKRDAILEALNFSFERILKTSSWNDSIIQEVTEKLGKSTTVSRVYIFENHFCENGELLTSQRYEWVDEGIMPQIDNQDLQSIPYSSGGFNNWYNALAEGNFIKGNTEDFSEEEQQILKPQHILSLVIVPIFIGNDWWGFMGFDECKNMRTWSHTEAEALRMAARILGSLIQRKKTEEEKKHLENMLHHSQKMESLGTLASGMAHEFNNILASIIINTELALEDTPAKGEANFSLGQVLTSTKRAKDLINRIMAFSRVSKIKQKPIKPEKIIQETFIMLKSMLPKTIRLDLKIQEDTGIIMADPLQLQQIVINLCNNAAHAMNNMGDIRISLLNETVSESNINMELIPGPYVKLEVKDHGSGIDPEIKTRIFDPFFTTKQLGQGTGLGLSIVHGIVKSCNGFIKVDSLPDKETTFQIYFPRIDTTLNDPVADESSGVLKGNENILFIDDEQAIVDSCRMMLSRLGYTVSVSTSAFEAFELFKNNPEKFDLVISDMVMPNMTGAELSKKISKIRPDLPVIICSGQIDALTVDSVNMPDVKNVIRKPFSRKELSYAIRKTLDENAIK